MATTATRSGSPTRGSGRLANNGGPTQTIALLAGSPAIGAGMNGIDGFTLFTDQRGYVPPAGVWDIGAYQYNAVPPAAPTAALGAANVTPVRLRPDHLHLQHHLRQQRRHRGVDAGRRGGAGRPARRRRRSDHRDRRQHGGQWPDRPFGNAQSFTVTYQITPPGGSWSPADNGTYSVTLGGSPVTDIDGTAIASGTIGSFAVQGVSTTTTLSALGQSIGLWPVGDLHGHGGREHVRARARRPARFSS